MRIKERWRSVRDWCGRTWNIISPGPEGRKGAIWGAIAVALWIAIVGGITLQMRQDYRANSKWRRGSPP